MAGAGIGVFPTLSAAVKTFVAVDRIFDPDLTQSERHKNGFEKYRMLYQQLVPWHAAVRKLSLAQDIGFHFHLRFASSTMLPECRLV